MLRIFVGASQKKLLPRIVKLIQPLGKRADYIEISGHGKNALDFHIAFYIGELASQMPDAFFHIISKDAGFDPLVAHLKSRKLYSCRSESVLDLPIHKALRYRSPGERAALINAKLQLPNVMRPGKLNTLKNMISREFHGQLPHADVAAVVAAMLELGFVAITDDRVIVGGSK